MEQKQEKKTGSRSAISQLLLHHRGDHQLSTVFQNELNLLFINSPEDDFFFDYVELVPDYYDQQLQWGLFFYVHVFFFFFFF
jgi:hypothetical protein